MFGFRKYLRFAYRSPKWPSVRKEHLSKQNHCAACGKTDRLEVHHIEPVHKSPDKELDPENLITLCADNCHLVFGHLMNYKSWNSSVVRDSAVYLNKVRNRPLK